MNNKGVISLLVGGIIILTVVVLSNYVFTSCEPELDRRNDAEPSLDAELELKVETKNRENINVRDSV
ncbi:hypothetical protein [Natranaerofaba carboxydovora]|uniref:hypothetical protein n=1 Tax=Natranaerofaba carboxydovora TaxID=2742683 RepID=UPI001F13FF59|nr:hypothetical protein [Natranaerofaba carboxydovora]UMZ74667.1 hypothetical protein ACONDI_02266 [Natranaerofaba carboxydovora]